MRPYVDDTLDLATIAEDLDHAEGVCWDPPRRCLWAGGEAGQIYRIGLDGEVATTFQIPGAALLGVALDGAGDLYLCDPAHHTVWRYDHEAAPIRYGPTIDYPNYAAFGPDGTLYVSDSGSFTEATGSILAISPEGGHRRLELPPIEYANGLCVLDGYLYYVASAMPGVWRTPLVGASSELVVTLPRCVPDGLAADSHGSLYISCYQPNQVWRLTAGELELLIDDWTGEFVLSPTNVAFFGEALERLAVASLCGRALRSVDVGARGTPVLRPLLEE